MLGGQTRRLGKQYLLPLFFALSAASEKAKPERVYDAIDSGVSRWTGTSLASYYPPVSAWTMITSSLGCSARDSSNT
jgi:hypothetical protein